MAVSLALNWNLPASSPLFDEGVNPALIGDDSNQSSLAHSHVVDTPMSSSKTSQTSNTESLSATSSDSSQRYMNGSLHDPRHEQNFKSYAAAASSSQPTLPAIKTQAQVAQPPAHQPQSVPLSHQSIPRQQALDSFVTEDGRRVRTTSGPQSPSHLLYNDTLHQHPVVSTSSQVPSSRGADLNHMSSISSLQSANGGYHPYRRTQKNDTLQTSAVSPYSQGPPVLPMPGESTSLDFPSAHHRVRSTSTTSSGTARNTKNQDVLTAPIGATYSSIVSGDARSTAVPGQTNGMPSKTTKQTEASPHLHSRTDSMTSQSSYDHSRSINAAPPPLPNARRVQTPVVRKPSPSPLSNRYEEALKHEQAGSDDENVFGGRTTPTPGDKQRTGLSGKLRKALSLSTLQQVEAAAAAPDRAYGGRAPVAIRKGDLSNHPYSSGDTNGSSGSTQSTSPPRTPDNGVPLPGSSATSISSRRSTRPPLSGADSSKRSIFNRKFNSSTDNISISSTVSSASVMLRKVGNIGKFARKSNLKGLTNMFKEKEDGRQGLHSDDFGITPADEVAAAKAGRKDKGGKALPASASVSHAVVELESTSSGARDSAMTPAASYVRQHQLQMRQQAEEDRIAREKAEAERLASVNKGVRTKNKTTDDMTESRQKMIEKEKERLKSKRGWRKRLGVGSLGSSSEVQQYTGLETVPLHESTEQNMQPHVQGGYAVPPSSSMTQAPPQLGSTVSYNDLSYDSAFGEEGLEPPHMPGAAEGYESSDDFETDSLRHWGEGIERSRESAAQIKTFQGILKNTPLAQVERDLSRISPSEAIDKPFAGRIRSNSYDAPQAGNVSTAVPPMSHITTATPDRVDGVRPGEEGRNSNDRAKSPLPTSPSTASNLGHHSNSSMPTLSLMTNPTLNGQRSVTASALHKRLTFADSHIYHSTWPAHVYDRRGELATCNRLTPLLAQRIKEELNTYKMEEMAVAPSSRIHTHFFV